MDISEIEAFYEGALRPVFGSQLRMEQGSGHVAHVILDGEREDFFFTIYGPEHVRLYWCNECFIFDGQRNQLVSSDTFGEIVYEGKLDAQMLPQMIVDLVLQLKDSTFLCKNECVKGKIPSGYDDVKDYVIQAKRNSSQLHTYQLANIKIEFQ